VYCLVSVTQMAQVELSSGRVVLSTSQLNVSTFCGIRWVYCLVSVTRMDQVELKTGPVNCPCLVLCARRLDVVAQRTVLHLQQLGVPPLSQAWQILLATS